LKSSSIVPSRPSASGIVSEMNGVSSVRPSILLPSPRRAWESADGAARTAGTKARSEPARLAHTSIDMTPAPGGNGGLSKAWSKEATTFDRSRMIWWRMTRTRLHPGKGVWVFNGGGGGVCDSVGGGGDFKMTNHEP
jgi:hypothetical protein